MVRGGEGGGPGGGLPPPVDKTSPTHTSGAWSEREGPRGGPPVDRSCEIGSRSEPELPPGFPDPTNRGTQNAGDGAISAHPPPRSGGRGIGRRERTVRTASNGDGRAHRRAGRWC